MDVLIKKIHDLILKNRRTFSPDQKDMYSVGYRDGYVEALQGVLWLMQKFQEEERKNEELMNIGG